MSVCLWCEAQVKWIEDSHQAIWDSNHEIVQTDLLITLKEDLTPFEVNKMAIRTKQLLWIKEATHSKVYTWESEAKIHGPDENSHAISKTIPCTLLLIIWKGYDPGHGWLLGLHISDAFRHSNISTSVGLKSFCPWCSKLGGTLKQSPSILERCIIGLQLCVTYNSLSPAWMHRMP